MPALLFGNAVANSKHTKVCANLTRDAAQLPLVIFKNLQSIFQHPQHLLMYESFVSVDLQLSDPFALRINNSTPFGHVMCRSLSEELISPSLSIP